MPVCQQNNSDLLSRNHGLHGTVAFNLADYIVNVKTDRAKVLLQNPDYKAADVAAAVGYSSAEYFSRIFRKKTGVTPAVWQKDRNSLQKN
mgnify:CR=1 FL=1